MERRRHEGRFQYHEAVACVVETAGVHDRTLMWTSSMVGKSMTLKMKTAALGLFGTGVALFLATAPMSGHHEPARKIRPGQTDHAERHRLED